MDQEENERRDSRSLTRTIVAQTFSSSMVLLVSATAITIRMLTASFASYILVSDLAVAGRRIGKEIGSDVDPDPFLYSSSNPGVTLFFFSK